MAKFLMVQGTSSSAGKSSLVAALCRIFSDKGYSVAPFKAQNMSSNIYITRKNREIAKAQAIQAIAARTQPSEFMNPILLKPLGDYRSAVIVMGHFYREMHAAEYYSRFATTNGIRYVKEALKELAKNFDIIIIEGAGGPAEINITESDIANMKVAEMVNCPVFIIADIERGGCFASIVGTMELLKKKHRKMVKGFIINKFRGDKAILEPALLRIEKITNRPILGVLPFVDDLLLPSEDSLGIKLGEPKNHFINIAIIKYPNAVNIADCQPLLHSSDALNTYYITSTNKLRDSDLVLLPSSRNLIEDLGWMRGNKIAETLELLRHKIPIIGICEGFAMMAKQIKMNGQTIEGIGLTDTRLVMDTTIEGYVHYRLASNKEIISANGKMLEGHLKGNCRITKSTEIKPLLYVKRLNGKRKHFAEGGITRDGLIFGCSVYGFFDNALVRNRIIRYLSRKKGVDVRASVHDSLAFWDNQIQKFSDIVKDNLNIERICQLVED